MKSKQSWVIRKIILGAIALSVIGCSREKNDDSFVLETGISVQEQKECNDKINNEEQASSVTKKSDGYEILVSDFFDCDTSAIKPYLTMTKQRRASLVLSTIENKPAFKSLCECARSLTVKVKDRLEPGDTLYLVRNHEVIGHYVLD